MPLIPGPTANSLFDSDSLRIQEIINKNLHTFLSDLDPVWRNTVATSVGVGNASDLGRDLQIIKLFNGSFAGILQQGEPTGDLDLYGDTTTSFGDRIRTQNLTRTYPDPRDGPSASTYELAFGMRSMQSNIMLTLGEKTAEATPAFIGQILAPKLIGHSRMFAHTLCNYFYLSQNNDYQLTDIAGTLTDTQVGSTAIHRLNFTPGDEAFARFHTGMAVDIYNSAGTTLRNEDGSSVRQKCFVESVNALQNEVTLIVEGAVGAAVNTGSASGSWATAPVVGDIVVYANSKSASGFTGIAGINSWLKNTGVLLGSEAHATKQINVDDHPEFMSFVKAVGGVLTEHKLRQYLARTAAAWDRMGRNIDTLIASDGVWLAYEATKIGRERLDRTGRLSDMNSEGSNEGFTFTFDGRTYKGHTSHNIEQGVMYGLKLGGGNWKKYVPPSPAGASSKGLNGLDPYVPFEFVGAAITGGGSNQMPIYDSSSTGNISLVTEGSQMPGRIRMQMAPDTPNMMKLTGLTEDRQYGD